MHCEAGAAVAVDRSLDRQVWLLCGCNQLCVVVIDGVLSLTSQRLCIQHVLYS